MTVTEQRTPVTPVRVELICDECGREMQLDHKLLSYPPQYVYMCMSHTDECRPYKSYDRFPRIDYEPIT